MSGWIKPGLVWRVKALETLSAPAQGKMKLIKAIIIGLAVITLAVELHAQFSVQTFGGVQPAQPGSIVAITADVYGLSQMAPADLPLFGAYWLISSGGGMVSVEDFFHGSFLSRNDAVEIPGSTAAPAVVRRALAPNTGAPKRTKRWVGAKRQVWAARARPTAPGAGALPKPTASFRLRHHADDGHSTSIMLI